MLNSLYHIEGYIIAHNHILNYLEEYVGLKKTDFKNYITDGLITLPEYSEAMDKLEASETSLNEIKKYLNNVRQNYVDILVEQRKKQDAE